VWVASLPVLLPWFLCSIHSFTFECPKAAALLVCSLWSCGVLCWVWQAITSLTCTYFSFGLSNANCTSLGLEVRVEDSLKIKRESWSCLHQWWCFGAQVEMEKIKVEHPDVQIRLWAPPRRLWLLDMFMDTACVLLSDWCENQKNCSAVPLERVVSGDMIALPVRWSTVKKPFVVFYIPSTDD